MLRRWAFVVLGRVEPQARRRAGHRASRFLRVCAARSRPDQRRTGDSRPATSLIRSTIWRYDCLRWLVDQRVAVSRARSACSTRRGGPPARC